MELHENNGKGRRSRGALLSERKERRSRDNSVPKQRLRADDKEREDLRREATPGPKSFQLLSELQRFPFAVCHPGGVAQSQAERGGARTELPAVFQFYSDALLVRRLRLGVDPYIALSSPFSRWSVRGERE